MAPRLLHILIVQVSSPLQGEGTIPPESSSGGAMRGYEDGFGDAGMFSTVMVVVCVCPSRT